MNSLLVKGFIVYISAVFLFGCSSMGYKVVNIKEESAKAKPGDYQKQDYVCSDFGGVSSYSQINVVECGDGSWKFWNQEWLDGDSKKLGGEK